MTIVCFIWFFLSQLSDICMCVYVCMVDGHLFVLVASHIGISNTMELGM